MRYVIIGGDAAGMSAAMQIVRTDANARVTTLEQGQVYSYAQCGLPYAISRNVKSLDQLVARTPEVFRDRYGIDARIHHKVQKVDVKNNRVEGIQTQTGESFELEYDKLLIATGARPIVPAWLGIQLPGVYPLKTMADAEQIMADLEPSRQYVTIVGGGYIGLEIAESMVALGKQVRIIEIAPQLARVFDPDMAELIREEAEDNGIEVRTAEAVRGFSGSKRVEQVHTDKGIYHTDLVILAIGVVPNTEFLRRSGIQLGVKGAVVVDPYMKTNISNVYAAGDCATQYHRIKEYNDYIPLGTHANKQGQVAGLNMAGRRTTFKGVLGSSIIKFFDLTLARTGLSEQEAQELGFAHQVISIKTRHIAHYYPGSRPMTIKLIYSPVDRRLLGGQIIGQAGVDKRIDVLATALHNQMTIDELLDLDLTYAPPYNSVWDPLQQAARKAMADVKAPKVERANGN